MDPLRIVRAEDVEEIELARTDRLAHETFGRDESTWMPWQWRAYLDAIDTVHAQFTPETAA